MKQNIEQAMLEVFEHRLLEEEKSPATREKYLRDVRSFFLYIGGGSASAAEDEKSFSKERLKEKAISWKNYLKEHYAPSSVNSMIAALNSFFKAVGKPECRVKPLKVQRTNFRSKNKMLTLEEYQRLIETAKRRGNRRLSCLMQTLGSTGIRISELPFITVEAIREGRAQISLKGKIRVVPLAGDLCELLAAYAQESGIRSGSIFVTRSGHTVDRSNVRHEMKALCEEANVAKEKVFPHNFRHMFACIFYEKTRDVVRLADILGHSNINTTRIYTSVSLEEQARLIESLHLIVDRFTVSRRRKKPRKKKRKKRIAFS